MKLIHRNFAFHSIQTLSAVVLLTVLSSIGKADMIVPTYEPAGVQAPNQPKLCSTAVNTCIVGVQTFDSWAGGAFTTDFGTSNQITGSYSGGFTRAAANQYGGAGGTGYYPEIFQSGGSYSVTLSTASGIPGVNYFGLWYSALDGGNLLQFYRGTTLLYAFTPKDFSSLVGACSASNAFCGNPTTNFKGQDSGEQFAFLNFFDTDGYFDKVVFSEPNGGGGFESDNHTVAYLDPDSPSGTLIYSPEPVSFLPVMVSCVLLLAARYRKRSNRQVA